MGLPRGASQAVPRCGHASLGHLAGILLQGKIDPVIVVQIIKAAATVAKDADVAEGVKFASNYLLPEVR